MITELKFEFEDGDELFRSCWKLQEAAVLQLIQLTDKHLRRFVLPYGTQSFIDLHFLALATNL
jgi:hypothetical protein